MKETKLSLSDLYNIREDVVKKFPLLANTTNFILEFNSNCSGSVLNYKDKTIYFNHDFMNQLSKEERFAIVAFELTRISLKHHVRCEGKDMKLWQLASNGVTIALLNKEGLVFPENTAYFKEAEDKTIDEVYEMLINLKNDGNNVDNIYHEVFTNHSLEKLTVREDESNNSL